MNALDAGPISPERLYSDDELCQFFTVAPQYEGQPYWRDKFFLVRFLLGTALRISEVLRLRVPEDCLTSGVVMVRRGSKSGRPRAVRVSPELEPFYKARLRLNEGGQRLFPGITCTKTLQNWCDLAFDVAGIEKRKGRGPHALRHQYATEELNAGRLKPWQVKSQLGHKSLNMTLNQYTHCLMERMYQQDKQPKWWAVAAMPQGLRIVEKSA